MTNKQLCTKCGKPKEEDAFSRENFIKFLPVLIVIFILLLIIVLGSLFLQDKIDTCQKKINEKSCINETIREWSNITLEQIHGYYFNYTTDNYYAWFSSDFYGVGCDKDVQLLKIGNEFTAISNHSGSRCYTYTIKEVCL